MEKQKSNRQEELVNGPDKFELMLSLFEKGKKVEFMIKMVNNDTNRLIQVMINSIQAEDGSRESWNIQGELIAVREVTSSKWLPVNPASFKGYYHSINRNGHIKF